MKKITGLMVGAALFLSSNAMAEFDMAKAYVGVGGSYNSSEVGLYDNALGFHGYAGYDMSDIVSISDEIGFAVETGYATSGDFEYTGCISCKFNSSGIWSTAVFSYGINDEIKAIGRVGYDFAAFSGLMFGAGAQYSINEQMAVRAEFVIRDIYKGIQADFIYYLGE